MSFLVVDCNFRAKYICICFFLCFVFFHFKSRDDTTKVYLHWFIRTPVTTIYLSFYNVTSNEPLVYFSKRYLWLSCSLHTIYRNIRKMPQLSSTNQNQCDSVLSIHSKD